MPKDATESINHSRTGLPSSRRGFRLALLMVEQPGRPPGVRRLPLRRRLGLGSTGALSTAPESSGQVDGSERRNGDVMKDAGAGALAPARRRLVQLRRALARLGQSGGHLSNATNALDLLAQPIQPLVGSPPRPTRSRDRVGARSAPHSSGLGGRDQRRLEELARTASQIAATPRRSRAAHKAEARPRKDRVEDACWRRRGRKRTTASPRDPKPGTRSK